MNDLAVNGVLTEYVDLNGAHGCLNQDCPVFKGVFMLYLGRLLGETVPSDPFYQSAGPSIVQF